MDIDALIEKRAKLIEKAGEILNTAEEEERGVTDEEIKRFDELHEEADRIQKQVERAKKQQEEERGLETQTDGAHRPGVGGGTSSPAKTRSRKEDQPFQSFGEQLQAVLRSAQPGVNTDPRLLGVQQRAAAAGMSDTVSSDGGFLVQEDFADELFRRVYETGLLPSRCRHIPISGKANRLAMNQIDETSRKDGSRWGGIQAFWAGEADIYQESTPKFNKFRLELEKLTGLCYATDELLEDAAALENVIMQGFSEEFGFKFDDAILNGSGVGMPQGILNSDALVTVAEESGQAADTILAQNIIKMYSRLWARSRRNAVWLINQDIIPQLFQMSIDISTAGGSLVYMPANGLSGQPYDTLFGRPVIPVEQAQTLGTVGDIIYADLSQYVLIDKGNMKSARSIHVKFTTGETAFRFTVRANGRSLWRTSLTPKNGSNTLSPFVALATRS